MNAHDTICSSTDTINRSQGLLLVSSFQIPQILRSAKKKQKNPLSTASINSNWEIKHNRWSVTVGVKNIYSRVRSVTAKWIQKYVCVREEWKKAHWCQTVLRCVFACGSVCVGILPCWSLKPIITVFCSKLKDNQEGGEVVLHLPISYPVEWSQLLWRRVFKLTGCGTESSSDVSVCASPKCDLDKRPDHTCCRVC